ncbi:MAG: hypothetical protein GXY60_06790 [Spirochaetales bacterium]|nr:hypothetical protein [Spirochaetales bacterium]
MFECKEKVAVCGHRGERVHGIENTIAAISYAADLGVDMIETDVRMSKDGHLFLMHNLKLEDLTDGNGYVCDHTYKELRSMNAAVHGKSSDDFSAPQFEHVALLDELLDVAVDYPDLMLNIELKDLPVPGKEDFAFESASKAANMLALRGLGNRTWLNSFSGKIVERSFKDFGNTFHYHGFYPWNIMGEMEVDPSEICDVVCLLNWIVQDDGIVVKHHTIPCPEAWYVLLLKKGIMPLTVSFYSDFQAYIDAMAYGSRILMADDPKAMLSRLRAMNLHN